ncbi:MAG: hypothetical protein KJ941_00100 [Bacteroidetes bacterium]|nr:hypothetical protein [Bacteroidota bacterium]
MSERQLVFGITSLLMIYGLSEFIVSRTFILPIPVYEILLFVLTIVLYKSYNRPDLKYRGLLLVAMSLFLLFSRSYTYLFFLPDNQVSQLDETLWLDGLYFCFMLAFLLVSFQQLKFIKRLIWLIPIGLFIVLDSFVPHSWFASVAFLFMVIIVGKSEKLTENGNSIWLFLFLLESTRTLTLLF